MSLTPKPIDTQAMIAAAREEASKYSTGTSYIKLNPVDSELRILPPAGDNPLPYRRIVKHQFSIADGFRNALCYDFLLANSQYQDIALDKGWITEDDLNMAAETGDPFKYLNKRWVERNGRGKGAPKAPSGLWPRTRFCWNAIDILQPNGVGVFESSQKFCDAIMTLLGKREDFLSLENGYNVEVTGNGRSGMDREYGDPQPAENRSPVPFDVSESMNDLDEYIARRVMPYEQKVNALFELYPQECAEYGIEHATFLG